MTTVLARDLATVPYLRLFDDGRIINLSPFWDGDHWHFWMPTPDGLIPCQIADCAQIGYVAKEPASPHDLHLPFLDFMWKRASWPELTRWLNAIESDIDKLAASLAKLDHFANCEELAAVDTTLFVVTEIEYLFGRCRSAFDNLQQIIAGLWKFTEPGTVEAKKAKRPLPSDSFRIVAQKVRNQRDGDAAPYGLPARIVDCYRSVNDFFFSLRDMRDKLLHRGGDVGSVFVTEQGHSVQGTSKLARMMREPAKEKLVSIRPILADLVCRTLYAMNDFQHAFASIIEFPGSIIPAHNYYLRTPHSAALTAAQQVLRDANGAQ